MNIYADLKNVKGAKLRSTREGRIYVNVDEYIKSERFKMLVKNLQKSIRKI